MNRSIRSVALGLGAVVGTLSLVPPTAAQDPAALDRNVVKVLFGTEPPAPKGPAASEKVVALGAKLFADKKLSANQDVSCATCHDLAKYGQDGKIVSGRTGGAAGTRNTPSILNAGRQVHQLWDYRADTLEKAVTAMLTGPEHGLKDDAGVVAALEGAGYADQFKAAFGGDAKALSAANANAAISAFVRTLNTKSRLDEWIAGKDDALTAEEKAGINTFITVGCTACHTTKLLGGHLVQKLGLVKPVEGKDLGRFEVSGNEAEKNLWKVPQLVNVAKTGPYMHDGSIKTLEEVTKFMADVQLGRQLTDAEVQSIVAFLNALTGKLPEDVAK